MCEHEAKVKEDFPHATAVLTNGEYFLIWDSSDLFVAEPIGKGATEKEAWETTAETIQTAKDITKWRKTMNTCGGKASM